MAAAIIVEERPFRAASGMHQITGFSPRANLTREMQTGLIDTLTVPEESKAAFLAETRKIQTFFKSLPGFIEGFVYEKTAGDNRINMVTTAVWENDVAMESAKKATAAQFQKIGVNPQQIMKELKAEAGRAVYRRTPY